MMTDTRHSGLRVVVTGVGIALPGDAPVDPASIVGRKGLRYKDRATQLGYCAAQLALGDAGLLVDGGLSVPGDGVGVVVSSNLGNIDTVCRAVDTIRAETVTGTSPMDLPNASSNVIASGVAIRFGLRGPNLTLCNGQTSGLDAVYWASVLIAAQRAAQVLVIGVEPDNPQVRALVGAPVLDGAVGLVLEDPAALRQRGAVGKALVAGYRRAPDLRSCLRQLAEATTTATATAAAPGHWLLPDTLSREWGLTSGALGVMQCAAAIGWLAQGGPGPVFAVAGGDGADATAGLVVGRLEEDR